MKFERINHLKINSLKNINIWFSVTNTRQVSKLIGNFSLCRYDIDVQQSI